MVVEVPPIEGVICRTVRGLLVTSWVACNGEAILLLLLLLVATVLTTVMV